MRQFTLLSVFALLMTSVSVPPASTTGHNENCFIIEGLHVEWSYEDHLLTFVLHSPYQGWLSLGFNTYNALPGSHLVSGQVVGVGPDVAEQFVVGFGDARSFSSLGAQATIVDYYGQEDNTGTTFTFTLDTRIKDEFHYDLREGQRIWLICAYSLTDDFESPSVMQRHIEVEL